MTTTEAALNPFALLVTLVVAVLAVSWAYRLARPVPAEDLVLITQFLRDREETLVKVEKMLFGGPESFGTGGRSGLTQTGRPYKLLARSHDGALWTHWVATHCLEHGRVVPIVQRLNGAWQIPS